MTETKPRAAFMGAAGYIAGPVMKAFKENEYEVVALVRPATDASGIEEIADSIQRGNLADPAFVTTATQGCVAILNFISQLMPPKPTMREQIDNDLPPILAGLAAATANSALFVHTSGNFSIPSKGRIGGTFGTELCPKPTDLPNDGFVEHWDTFGHEGGMVPVSLLAEAKFREDWAVADYLAANPDARACVVIPAGVYGAGVGKKISFWDMAAAEYLAGRFGDFAHAFVHIEDAAAVYLAVVRRGVSGGRYAAYGENVTVREFTAAYAAACGVPMVDGPQCAEEERRRRYDDSASREALGVAYKHTLRASLADAVADLRRRGVLMVKSLAEAEKS